MGAIFEVGLARVSDATKLPGERIALLAGHGEPLWAVLRGESRARAHPGKSAHDTTGQGERRPVTLLVGAEREGLPDELVAACEHVAHIPIASESLNAAMAATVALYEMTRPSSRVPAS